LLHFRNHAQKQQEESRARVATLQSAIKSIAATSGEPEEANAVDADAGGDADLDSFEAKAPGADQLDGLNEV
jgi:hypothetical protein